MAFVPAPNIVMVEVRALFDGQKIENRFMVDVLTAVTSVNLGLVAVVVNNWAQGTYFDHLPSAISLTEIVATDMSVQNGEQHTIAPVGAFTGALLGAPMPNETTLCISLRSTARGRSARGRAYVLGLAKDDVTGNFISSARATNLVDDFEALRAGIAANGWLMTVVSYRTNNAPRSGGPVYFPVTTVLVTDLLVDSMKRRKPGVGT